MQERIIKYTFPIPYDSVAGPAGTMTANIVAVPEAIADRFTAGINRWDGAEIVEPTKEDIALISKQAYTKEMDEAEQVFGPPRIELDESAVEAPGNSGGRGNSAAARA